MNKCSEEILSKTHKQDILMESLQKFYLNKNNLKIILEILQSKNKISLRIIDWFVTNYAKKHNTNYKIKVFNGINTFKKQFIVYIDYKLQLKGYSKKQFDPFCRRNRIKFFYSKQKYITTTVGQLNFFRWAINNKIIDYIMKNLSDIENDMNKSYKAVYKLTKKIKNKRRKRQELSLSATRSVNKHKINIIVSFD
jgi:hypothetical protein